MDERRRGRDPHLVAPVVAPIGQPAAERDGDRAPLTGRLQRDAGEEPGVLLGPQSDVGSNLVSMESGHEPQNPRGCDARQETGPTHVDVCTYRVHSGAMDDAPNERTERKPLPMSADEKRLMEAAARVLGLPWAQWARTVLLPAAREVLAKAGAR